MACVTVAATGWWCWMATVRNDPADIPAMLEEASAASRRIPRAIGTYRSPVNRRDDWVKRLSSRLANGFRDPLLRGTASGYRLRSSRWCGATGICACPASTTCTATSRLLIQAQGPHVPWPVNHRPRQAGVSKIRGLEPALGRAGGRGRVCWLQRRSKVVGVGRPRLIDPSALPWS